MTTCKDCHYREGSPDGEAIGTCYGPPPTPVWGSTGLRMYRPEVYPSSRACSLYRPNEKMIGHDGRKGARAICPSPCASTRAQRLPG